MSIGYIWLALFFFSISLLSRFADSISCCCLFWQIPIDLRWGLTEEDSKSGKVITTCMTHAAQSEIFLSILGHRYGWVVPDANIPENIRTKYGWTSGRSVTEMEVQVAMKGWQSGSRKSVGLFMIRDSLPANINNDPKVRELFGCPDSSTEQLMTELRNVAEHSRVPVHHYTPQWEKVNV